VTPALRAAAAIEATGIEKRFGPVVALAGVDLRVADGEVVSLFGPNGAGKTTLIRVLTQSLRPGSGQVRIAGLDPRRDDLQIRRVIGLISHQSLLYDDLTATENLVFYARLYGVERPRERAAELLSAVGLTHRAHDAVSTLSRGLQQRLSVARALVHGPRLLFLDEPFSGLDPHATDLLRTMLADLRRQGCAILLVTHDLRQGLEISDRWLLLGRGRIVDEGPCAGTDLARLEAALRRPAGLGPAESSRP
jgi:heme exporter protein A